MLVNEKYNVDVAVIGGGSAGLAAAIVVKKAELDVLILERDKELGGITLQCIHNGFGLHEFEEELTGPEYVQRFINQAEELKIPSKLDTMVIEFTPDKTIYAVNKEEGLIEIKAKAIILAMGCREKTRGAINIPGFRPAGIYTAGQAQRFVNIEGYLPGRTYVILGSGDIGMIMARRLTWEGCVVKAVVEIQPYVSGLLRNEVQCLEDYGIPLITSYTVTKIHGKERVQGVTISKVDRNFDRVIGSDKFIECDTLLLSVGLIPENELTREAGAKISQMGGPIVDNNLETTIEGVFACGNVLQVHDLVDNVALEGTRAGEMAVNYIHQKLEEEEQKISCLSGNNVAYVVPQIIHPHAFLDKITFFMRSKKPQKEVYVEFIMAGELIYRKFQKFALPSEMIKVILPSLKL